MITRGFITRISGDNYDVITLEECNDNPDIVAAEYVIPRHNVIGNTWTLGWHGFIIIDEELKETFFKADS